MRPWAEEVCKHLHPWKPREEHFPLQAWMFRDCGRERKRFRGVFEGIFRKKKSKNGLFEYRVGMARCLQLKGWISSGRWGG